MSPALTEPKAPSVRRAEPVRVSPAELREILSDPDRWVGYALASQITGVPVSTLRSFRYQGIGPRYAKCGHRCRYKVGWLTEYLSKRVFDTRESTPQPAEAFA